MNRQHDLPAGPNDARMYDYILGGKDNVAADRAAVACLREQAPAAVDAFVHNRQFVHRAIRLLAGEYGIDQFLDLGCGLPRTLNVHQVAGQHQPEAQVVYIDNDPIVMAHVHALLATHRHTAAIDDDVTAAGRVLAGARAWVDLSAPVAVLLTAVAHLIDDAAVARMLDTIADLTTPGSSYLVFTQLVGTDTAAAAELQTLSTSAQTPPWRIRTPAEVDTLLARWTPVAPGVGDIARWPADTPQPPAAAQLGTVVDAPAEARFYTYGGVLQTRPGSSPARKETPC